MKSLPVLLSAILILAPMSVLAQNFSGPLSPGAFESTLNMGPIAHSLRQQTQSPAAAQQAAPANLTFTPDTKTRSRVFASFVDNARKTDATMAAELEKVFAKPEFFPTIEKELGRYGLRADNIADAYTVWWITMWQASRGLTDDPTPQSALAVKGQAERALAATPIVTAASDADKQELSETLLIKGMLMGAAVAQAKTNPEQLKAVTGMALQGGRESGLDFGTMTLTDQGFTQQ
jgi:hypothetical protein